MRRLWTACLLLVLITAACDALTAPTPAPTRQLSAPTLAPTTPFSLPGGPPTEIPANAASEFGANDPTVAALPNDQNLPPLSVETGNGNARSVQITLDNDILPGELYTNVPVRAPGVLLLSTDRTRWASFPGTLEENGYVVLAVDTPDVMNEVTFQQLIGSFSEFAQGEDSRLDPARIVVIGERTGADIALRGCAVDARCSALGLLTPTDADGAPTLAAQYGQRPLLVSASVEDTDSYTLAQTLANASNNVLFQPFEAAGSGAALLQNRPDFSDLILSWLNESVRS